MRPAVFLVILITGIIQAGNNISIKIIGAGTTGPYRLGYNHIIKDSEKVELKGRTLTAAEDYFFDFDEGLIDLIQPLAIDDTLKIYFSVLPLDIKSSYRLMQPIAITETTVTANPFPVIPGRAKDKLDIIGSKGFAINIGNQGDPTLTQSLDLDLTGTLGGDIYVKGSVSDQNFGAAAGGGTKSLDELDKIYLSVESKGFRGDFGDIEIKGTENSLLDFRRKLTGLSISGGSPAFDLSSSVAFSPGKQAEIFFYGIDGKQGPYFLQTNRQFLNVSGENVFLPGTEEIYLDGRKLEQGSEKDYNIDYYAGYIEFTPANIISSKSRITVKIQYAPEGYRKSFYNVKSFANAGLTIGVQYLGEKDDKSSPRTFDLGDTEREVISRAGAYQDSAYISGAKFVGQGNGNYIQEVDSLGIGYFFYAGPDSGDYNVSFSRVPFGEGSYRYAGSGVYIYTGAGNGFYLPVMFYPLPENKDYGSVIIKKDGDLYYGGELAFSRNDRNTISDRDQVLTGKGLLGNLGLKKENLSLWGKTWNASLLDMKIRSLDDDFYAPGIVDPPEFFRHYNLPQSRPFADDRLYELQSQAVADNGDYANIGGGVFRSNDFDAERGFGEFNITTLNLFRLLSNTEISKSRDKISQTDSKWNKYENGISLIKGRLQPGFIYRHELNEGLNQQTANYKAKEYEGILLASIAGNLTSKSKFLLRDQATLDQSPDPSGGWIDQYRQYQMEQGFSYSGPANKINAELNLARLHQEKYYPAREELTRNMGNIKVNYNSPDLSLTYYENVNGTGRTGRAREYIFVGEGKGDYRRDGDDYIYEPGGDYIEVIREIGETELSGYEIGGGLRARLSGALFNKSGVLNNLNFENELSFKTYLAAAVDLEAQHLLPFYKYKENEINYRNYNYNQRTTLRLNRSGDYARHTLKNSRTEGSQYQFENQSSRSLGNIGELKTLSRNKLSYLFTVEYTTEKSQLLSGLFDLQRYRLKLVPEINPMKELQIETPLEFTREAEKSNDITIVSYTAGINSVINIRNSGRLELDGTYARVDVDREGAFIPYILAAGKKQGDNFSGLISARFKLNSYSRIELQYRYKNLGDGYSISNLRLEAKAEF